MQSARAVAWSPAHSLIFRSDHLDSALRDWNWMELILERVVLIGMGPGISRLLNLAHPTPNLSGNRFERGGSAVDSIILLRVIEFPGSHFCRRCAAPMMQGQCFLVAAATFR